MGTDREMTTHKHTPGDWQLGDFVWHTFEGGGQRLQELTCDSMTLALIVEDDHDAECPANAALIAAAPELLAALEAAVRVLENECPDWGGVKLGRAAIAKATGGEGSK